MAYGVCNVYAESIGTLAPFTELANIDAAPYLYTGYDHFINVWQSDLGKEKMCIRDSFQGSCNTEKRV